MARLSDLPPELVLRILRLCDVATILRVSETCRFLHNVVFDKSCWIDVVRDLQRRGIIDDSERVHELSAEDLVQLLTVPVPDPSAYWLSAKLLPGGRHILINSGGELSCNNVAEGACIWRYEPLLPGNPSEIRVLEFHFGTEVGESGQHTIFICLEGEHGDYVDVVELDVATGSHRVLLCARVPISDTMSNGILCNPVVCGTLAAVGIHPHRSLYLIVDLAQQLAFILEFQFDCRDDEREPDNAQQLFLLDLARGYIVVRARSVSGTEEHLHIISAEIAFRLYGRALPPLKARIPYAKTSKYYNVAQLGSDEFKEAILITQVVTETSLPDSYECNRVMQYIENTLGPDAAAYGALRVFADPLRDDIFRVWVYISATRIEREDSGRRYRNGWRISYRAPHSQDDEWFSGYAADGLLCLYELDVSVPPAQQPRLREVRRGPAPAAVVCSGLTSSGHVTSSTLEIYPPFALFPVRWEVPSQQDPETGRAERWDAHVAAYTGDVTLANRRAIVVHRFA
uniref:F-box domain-containing protein n=1 Tax=Mycena chlorophos TaxID=658473 RepID=A0ABQ0MBR0_MYCCL|nr:predicted protein [Mycena chlorophos]